MYVTARRFDDLVSYLERRTKRGVGGWERERERGGEMEREREGEGERERKQGRLSERERWEEEPCLVRSSFLMSKVIFLDCLERTAVVLEGRHSRHSWAI